MGMFDYLICEFPLKHNPPIKVWQTKSMGRHGDVYRILSNGVLQRAEIGDDDAPSQVPDSEYRWYDFRGDISFTSGEYTYEAKFYNGFLVEICCTSAPGS